MGMTDRTVHSESKRRDDSRNGTVIVMVVASTTPMSPAAEQVTATDPTTLSTASSNTDMAASLEMWGQNTHATTEVDA